MAWRQGEGKAGLAHAPPGPSPGCVFRVRPGRIEQGGFPPGGSPLTAIAPAATTPLPEGATLPPFAEALPCAVAVLGGADHRVLAANAAWCRLAGATAPSELL